MDPFLKEFAAGLGQNQPPTDPVNADPVNPPADPGQPPVSPVEVPPIEQLPNQDPPVSLTPPAEPAPVNHEPNTDPKPWYEEESLPPADPQNQNPTPVDPVYEDPEVKMVVEARKAGKTLLDLAREMSVPDYTKFTDEQVLETMTREMFPDQENFDRAIGEFESFDMFTKAQRLKEFREVLNKRAEAQRNVLLAPLEQQRDNALKIQQRFESDLAQTTQSFTDQEYRGLKITADMAKELHDYVNSSFSLIKPDGTPDAQKMFEFAVWEKYGATLVKANVQKAKSEGRNEVIAAATNPSPNPTPSGPPQPTGGGLEDAFAKFTKPKH